ncbi:hypothetical protein CVT26_016151 [Gymnopilus dilepis]|uniref:F-box domain-containing protein n=1 Tax=Gymnopilus dilepis TaxID=231916 RepID=A0A409XYY3_9AGAR|nr:hypothetical protein CVT26_016151 [Gymnopilus dilepis]
MTSGSIDCTPTHHFALRCDDILTEVFDRVLDPEIHLPPPARHSHFVISQVNNQWRGIVLSTPRYWTSYSFTAAQFQDVSERMDIVIALLKRSRTQLLSFSFLPRFGQLSGPSLSQAPLRNLLFGAGRIDFFECLVLPYADRISSLKYIFIGHGRSNRTTSGLPLNAFRVLKKLDVIYVQTVHNGPTEFSQITDDHFFAFKQAEALRELTCEVVGQPSSFVLLHFPLRHLSKLFIEGIVLSFPYLVQVMQLCSSTLMEGSFTVELHENAQAAIQRLQRISMACLDTLCIQVLDASNDPLFADSLPQFPILADLTIKEADRSEPFCWNLEQYFGLVSNCASSLHTFRLADLQIDPATGTPVNGYEGDFLHRLDPVRSFADELEALFRIIPNVVNLSLPLSIDIPPRLLDKIANGTFLPLLGTLEIGTKSSPAPIFNMVSRRNGLASLSTAISSIEYLGLFLPTMLEEEKAHLEKNAGALNLEDGYDFWYVKCCKKEDCQTFCFLASSPVSE